MVGRLGFVGRERLVDDRIGALHRLRGRGTKSSSEPIHLFDVFRGPHWTILLFDEQRDRPKLTNELWGAPVRTRQILDHTGSCAFTADTALVVRPDGYIARITHPDNLTDSSSLVARNAWTAYLQRYTTWCDR